MSINNILRNATGTRWNLTDDFDFYFQNSLFNLESVSSQVNGLRPQALLDMCVMNIDMPQLSGDIDAVLHAGEYRLNAKKFQPFTITVTFRDVLGLKLRDFFIELWSDTQTEYFDDIKSTIEVQTQGNLIFKSDMCLIASVSQVQLDNSNAQISEFSVEFQTPYYTNYQLKEFGKR